jgi:hypothetical protein
MAIRDLPEAFDAFERFNVDYERERFRFSEANRATALATREMFAGWGPRPLRPLVRRAIDGLLDEPVRTAFGLAAAPRWLSAATGAALRGRAALLRVLPKRRRPRLRTRIARVDYPRGYTIESLGPPPASAVDDDPAGDPAGQPVRGAAPR